METSVPDGLPRHFVSITGVVVRFDGHVLAIQRRDDDTWVPPGGVLELDEALEQGVVREVLEETGVRVRPDKLTGVYKNMVRGVVSLAFRCTPLDGEPQPTNEAVSVRWMTREDAARHMVEARAIRVLDAFRDDGPHVRTHDGRRVHPMPAAQRQI